MKKFPLIPRVRVNYTFSDILKAFFTSESTDKYRGLVHKFLSTYFNNSNIILTSSGRSSLYILLRSLPQNKVVIPAYTCKVVYDAVFLAGKQVVYLPTSSDDFNVSSMPHLDDDTILVATHQYGLPCEIDKLAALCKQANAVLIEDCAGSFGTKYNGKLTGTFGDYAFFSFDASKLINVPSKGGFIMAKTEQLLSRISLQELSPPSNIYKLKHLLRGLIYCLIKPRIVYRVFHYITMGRENKMHINESNGVPEKSDFYSHLLCEWQARIAYNQLCKLKEIISKRERIYKYYNTNISNLTVQKPPLIDDSVCIRYTIQVDSQQEFYVKCLNMGVDLGFSFNHIECPEHFVNEHQIAQRILNLPFYYNMREDEIEYVVKVINSI